MKTLFLGLFFGIAVNLLFTLGNTLHLPVLCILGGLASGITGMLAAFYFDLK